MEEIEIWHVLPTKDIEEHTELSTCKCCPRVEKDYENGVVIIVHNSFDGRELVEQANEIIKYNIHGK